MRLLLLLVFSIVTAACGGGGGGSDGATAADDVNGIWREPASGKIGIISGGGDVDIVWGCCAHYHGSLYARRGAFQNSRLHSYFHGVSSSFLTGEGTVIPKATILADYYYNGKSALTLDMIYDPISDRQPSLGLIGGIWSQTTGQYTLTITINSDGSLFGSDTNGCNYTGSVTIPHPNVNTYKIHMFHGCEGSYIDGQGIVIDTVTANDTLIFAVSGHYPNSLWTYSFSDTLYRQ